MECNKERVLAYTLAKGIDHEELSNVSGGGAGMMTTHRTVKVTGSSGQGVDYFVDASIDW